MVLKNLLARGTDEKADADEDTEDDEDEVAVEASDAAEGSGSRLGSLKKTVGIAVAGAVALVTVRKLRERRSE